MITNFCSLHFAMKDEHLQQFIPQITLSNYKAVVTKMLYLGEYVRDNWNKISNKAEYCLSIIIKRSRNTPRMIGRRKKMNKSWVFVPRRGLKLGFVPKKLGFCP